MKKITALIIAAIMCFSLVGCAQKSQDVKNTEVMIKAIGTVTQDSGEDIVTAEKFYNKLTSEEKGQVSNYNTLIQARNDYNEMIMYGQWVKYMSDKSSTLTLNEDGSFEMSDGTKGSFEKDDTQVVLTADSGEVTTLQKDVHMNLVHLVDSDGTDYIRPELLTTDWDKVVSSSWYRFFDVKHHVHIDKDIAGIATDYYNSFIIVPNEEYLPYVSDITADITMTYTTRNIVTMHKTGTDELLIIEEPETAVECEVTAHITTADLVHQCDCFGTGYELVKGPSSRYKDYKTLYKTLRLLENGEVIDFTGEIHYYDQLKEYYENK